jgi:hypothetical protein
VLASRFSTPITGQSFLTSRFGDVSILSPLDPWQIMKIDARSDSGSEEFKLLRKFLSQSDIRICSGKNLIGS